MSTRRSLIAIAWGQALASLRHRRGRHALTGAGIALAVAMRAGIAMSLGPSQDALMAQRATWFTSVALAMCVVGVANSMLMAVFERMRELGTLKCLGASGTMLWLSVAFEAAVLGAFSSCFGAVLGVLAVGVGAGWRQAVSVLFESASIGFALTLAAAIVPAVQAARMQPADALRGEA